jgi:hypothetical protein
MPDQRPPTNKDTTSNIFKGPNGKFRLPDPPKGSSLKAVFTGKGTLFDYLMLILLICMFIPQTIWYAWPIGFLYSMYCRHCEKRNEKEELKAQNICSNCKRPL